MTHPSPETLRRGYLCASLVVIIWTGFVIVSRIGGKSALTSYDVIALRYMVSGVIFLPFWWHHRTNLWDRKKLILSLSGAIIYALFVFAGFRYAPASHAAILLPGFLPFAVTIIAYLILREKVSRQRAIGLAIITLGVGCVAIENFSKTGIAFAGDSLMLAASCCWALYTVLLRKWHMNPLDTAIAVTLIAAGIYLPIYVAFLPKALDIAPWSDILLQAGYQGILAAVIQMILYAKSVTLLGPTRMGLVMAFIPVSVGLTAVPLLDEPLTPLICAGLLLVSFGAWVGNRRKTA